MRSLDASQDAGSGVISVSCMFKSSVYEGEGREPAEWRAPCWIRRRPAFGPSRMTKPSSASSRSARNNAVMIDGGASQLYAVAGTATPAGV